MGRAIAVELTSPLFQSNPEIPMIYLSSAAIAEISRLKARHPHSLFRLSVKSGGCEDWYYTLMFDHETAAGDCTWNCNGVDVIVDAQSLIYLNELTIDYSEDLMGGGFRFNNPQAIASCGCGNSFSVDAASLTK